jgi:ankyrin repeat protein
MNKTIKSSLFVAFGLLVSVAYLLFVHNPKKLANMIRDNDVIGVANLIRFYPYLVNIDLDRQTKLKPLDLAASLGCAEICSNLISTGADINSRDRGGETPLYHIYGNFNSNIFTMLIQHGANVSNLNMYADTPLYNAVINKNREAVGILVQNGADSMHTNDFGKTYVDYAIASSNEEVIGILLMTNSAYQQLQLHSTHQP